MPRKIELEEKVRKLREFFQQERRIPGYAEMLELFGYRSKNAVFGLLKKLEELGYIVRSGHKLAPTGKLTGSVRLLGSVQAGFPSPAEEELADTISLDEYLIRRPEATFMLTVSGDSMIDAGIHPGDIVIVEKGNKPKKGDIVVANVDDEWTMKYFTIDQAGVRLDPANPKYRFIRPRRSLNIGGIVKAVIRRYG
ncbi:MAG TPA: repressor LexA [Verrucomicrobia bacterium]|nr:MAG: repressor LexA [Lentisphaerae bacterium GWF2_57_35]HBA84449.1 repressor LexA [Verrucomicrobiota bacterium]